MEAFVKFPLLDNSITALTYANWGPQDQNRLKENKTRKVDIFKSRSVSGFLLYMGALSIGYPKDNLSQCEAQPKLKYML